MDFEEVRTEDKISEAIVDTLPSSSSHTVKRSRRI